MPDDPRDRRTPPKGVPPAKVGTDPLGVPIVRSPISRPVTERGGGAGGHDRYRKQKLTPAYIKAELARRVDTMGTAGADFEREEFTPITTIAVVRQELKEDLAEVRHEIKEDVRQVRDHILQMKSGQDTLVGAITSSNAIQKSLLEQLLGVVTSEFTNRQTLTFESVTAQLETNSLAKKAEEERKNLATKAEQERQTFSTRERWLNIGKVVGFVASVAGLTTIVNLIMSGRC